MFKYYKKCQDNLGNIEFQKLITELTKKIIKKFGKSTRIEQFVTILDINIKTIMLLSIAEAFPDKKEFVINEAKIGIKYLTANSLDNFIYSFNHYISIISHNLKKKNCK